MREFLVEGSQTQIAIENILHKQNLKSKVGRAMPTLPKMVGKTWKFLLIGNHANRINVDDGSSFILDFHHFQ